VCLCVCVCVCVCVCARARTYSLLSQGLDRDAMRRCWISSTSSQTGQEREEEARMHPLPISLPPPAHTRSRTARRTMRGSRPVPLVRLLEARPCRRAARARRAKMPPRGADGEGEEEEEEESLVKCKKGLIRAERCRVDNPHRPTKEPC